MEKGTTPFDDFVFQNKRRLCEVKTLSALSKILLGFSNTVQEMTSKETFRRNNDGCTGADVFVSKSWVIKSMPINDESRNEWHNYVHMQKHIPIPRLMEGYQNETRICLMMERLKGNMLEKVLPKMNPVSVVDFVARSLKTLWSTKLAEDMLDQGLDVRLKQARENVQMGLVDMSTWDADIIRGRFKTPESLLSYLVENSPMEFFVCSHGDFCFENIFIMRGKLSGFIDIGRMGRSDRYQDLALAIRCLRYSSVDANQEGMLLSQLGLELNLSKIDYYLLLDELF